MNYNCTMQVAKLAGYVNENRQNSYGVIRDNEGNIYLLSGGSAVPVTKLDFEFTNRHRDGSILATEKNLSFEVAICSRFGGRSAEMVAYLASTSDTSATEVVLVDTMNELSDGMLFVICDNGNQQYALVAVFVGGEGTLIGDSTPDFVDYANRMLDLRRMARNNNEQTPA